MRVEGAACDFKAVGAQYHRKCKLLFMNEKNISSVQKKQPMSEEDAFRKLVDHMEQNKHKLWSSVGLFAIYLSYGGTLVQKQVLAKISRHFEDTLLIMSASGFANVFVFKSHHMVS